ncbi:MAG: tetratricopeptide repeat protein [Cycloclasticus sp.]
MTITKKLSVFGLTVLLAACASLSTDEKKATEREVSKAVTPADARTIEIEQQIVRIEKRLKDKPTSQGWILVGDANIYLQRYEEAIRAYQQAYLLSEGDLGIRKKLRRAIYLSATESRSTH